MHAITISLHAPRPAMLVPRQLHIPMPASWNECSTPELLTIASLLLAPLPDEQQHLRQCQIFLALLALHMRQALRKQHPWWPAWLISLSVRRTLRRTSVHDMGMASVDALPWLSGANTLTRQPFPQGILPQYRAAPHSSFMDITVAQYADALVFFEQFAHSKQLQQLPMLAKVLYSVPPAQYHTLPPDPEPGPFAKVPANVLFVIYQWFAACHEEVATTSKVYAKAKAATGTPASQPQAPAGAIAFTQLMHHHAGTQLGTIADVRRLPLRAFLFHLDNLPDNKPE